MKLKYEIDHEVAVYINQCLMKISIAGQAAHIHVEALEAIDSPKNRKEYENFVKEEAEKVQAAQQAAANKQPAVEAMEKVAKAKAKPKAAPKKK